MPKMPMIEPEIKALSAYLLLNKEGGQAAVTAAIAQEVDTRLAAEKTAGKVALTQEAH
jgi:hypothetical protein